MPISKFKSASGREVAALVGQPMVSPSDFVEWGNMKLTSKYGTDFSKGPLKEHIMLDAKWIPLKVQFINSVLPNK